MFPQREKARAGMTWQPKHNNNNNNSKNNSSNNNNHTLALGCFADSLDLVLGSWVDADQSTYSVQLDGGQSSCTVFTTRPSGAMICTMGLIRLRCDKVLWSSIYSLDCQTASAEEIRWVHKCGGKDYNNKDYVWRRDLSVESQFGMIDAEPDREALRLQPCRDDEEDLENESDDDELENSSAQHRIDKRHVPVDQIRWAHNSIRIRFRNGRLLVQTLEDLLAGKITEQHLPPFHVMLHEDRLFAVTGNRQLWVLRELQLLTGKQVRVKVKCLPPPSMNTHWCRSRFTTKNDGVSVEIVRQRFAHIFLTMPDALRAASLGHHCGPESVYGEALADHAAGLENHCGLRFVYGEALADHAASLETHCGPESVHGEAFPDRTASLENHFGPGSVYAEALADLAAVFENHSGTCSVFGEALTAWPTEPVGSPAALRGPVGASPSSSLHTVPGFAPPTERQIGKFPFDERAT
ncbi:unnamed protein product, partial [Polarella glacialis]